MQAQAGASEAVPGDQQLGETSDPLAEALRASASLQERLRISETFVRLTGRCALIGGWEMDLNNGLITWSEQMNRLNDRHPGYCPSIQEGLDLYSDDSRPLIESAIAEAQRAGKSWDLELQKKTATGRYIWVRHIGEVQFEHGSAVRMVGSMQDITARKQSESFLQYERDLMSSMLQTHPGQICFKDKDGRYLRVNPGLVAHYRLRDAADAIGRSDADYFTDGYIRRTAATERRIIETGESALELREEQEWNDRPPSWALISRMPLYDASASLIGTLSISRDITEEKRIDAQLQATTERFAIASTSAGIGSWEFDVVSQRLTWDDRMYVIYGARRGGATEPLTLWTDSVHPDDRIRCESAFNNSLQSTPDFEADFRIVRPGGEIRYLRSATRSLRAPDGTALRVTGVNIDMTQQRHAQHQLLEASSQLQIVLDSVTKVAIIATDAQLTIKVFNAGAEEMLGYSSEELIGHATPMVLYDPIEVHARSPSFGNPIEGWAVVVQPAMLKKFYEWTYVRKNGKRITVSQMVVPMHTDQGELLGYVSVARDVTNERNYQESLRETTRRAEQASNAKSRFLANMSHEIRTPMNAVIGLSYLLEQTALDEQQSTFLKKINSASRALLAIINDVLDLSKIEAGELIVEDAPINLSELLAQLRDDMSRQASAKAIAFTLDAPVDLPAGLRGDAQRLTQILTNLLSNAIRFTDQGGVVLRVTRLDSGAHSAKFSFSVQDTGIGISSTAQTRLFIPFSQADNSITRRFGGTGLGLSIVKSLVELIGGAVSVKSEPGVGSEFNVIVDLDISRIEKSEDRHAVADADRAQGLLGIRVLVVDDSDVNLDVTKRILELAGARVNVANNGLEAVELIQAQPHDFDIVLMDIQMPVLDGYAATGRIRRDLGLVDLPIIALTAGALSSERDLALAAGMDDFVIKPFEPRNLLDNMQRQLNIASEGAATPISVESGMGAQGPAQWPLIDGIDTNLARIRLMNDFDLFQSGLKRLLREFVGISIAATALDAESLAADAGRMHKLKGIAATMGAIDISLLASDANAACASGERARASEIARAIRVQMDRLQCSAAPVLEAATRNALDAAVASEGTVEPHLMTELLQLLRQQNLSAVERFVTLSPLLRGHLGDDFQRVREQLDNLEFKEVARALEARQPVGRVTS